MLYKHRDYQGKDISLPVGKVVCVGRNYAAHAKELGNTIPESPLLFMKPKSSLCAFDSIINIPKDKGAVHFETEIAVLLKTELIDANETEVCDAIWGYGIALDLTLRDLQNELKEKGQPWEKAKAFDKACPVTGFVSKEEVSFENIRANSFLNNKVVQQINPQQMLWPMPELIVYMSKFFTLEAGDIILTGTPEGVGGLTQGDEFSLEIKNMQTPIFERRAGIS